jgi:hypothetical protein
MRRRPVYSARLALALLACLAVPASTRAQLQWDPGMTGTAAGGSGTWTASAIPNWFNGTTNVAWDSNNAVFAGAAGTVTIDTVAPPSATGLTFNTSGYTLDLGGGTITVTGGSLGTFGPPPTVGTPTIGVGANLSATINAPIGGTGVVYVGAGNSSAFSGTLTLGGTNTFTAGVNITGGATLVVSSDANFGPNPGTTAANILINNGTLHIPVGFTLGSHHEIEMPSGGTIVNGVQQIGGGGTIIVDSGTFSVSTPFIPASNVCTITGAGNMTVTGQVSSFTPNGHLIKNGSGTLTINNGSNSGSLTSDITINGGAISIDQSNSLGNSVQPLTLNGGALDSTRTGTFQFINGGRAIIIGPNGGTINFLGNAATTQTYTAGATGGLQGSGAFTLTGVVANAAAILQFSSNTVANTNSGSTTVNNATLQTGATNVLSASSAVILSNLGKLNIAGFSQTIASLADGTGSFGNVTLGNAGAGTLTLGGDNTSTTFSGVISGNGTSGGIVKNGTGTFTLSGGASTYGSGAGTGTTVNNGTLSVTNTTGSAIGSGFVTVNAGAAAGAAFGTLGGTGIIAGPVTVNAGTGGGPNGVIQPGTATTPIATLTLQSNLTLPGTYNATIDPTSASSSLLAVGGVLDLTGGASTLNVSSLPGASSGATYILATFGSLNGTFTNTFLPSGYTVNYALTAITISPVPEPACILLACAGAAGGLGWYRRRR